MRRCCGRGFAAALAALLLASTIAKAQWGLDPIKVDPTALNRPRDIELAILINDVDQHLVESFTFNPSDGRLSIKRSELREIGIKGFEGDGTVVLNDYSNIAYHYDDAHQTIDFTLADTQRLPRVYNAHGSGKRPTPTSDIGLLMNYTIFASSTKDQNSWGFGFTGANASLDAHLFSPVGVLSQSGIVGTTTFSNASALRLDSDYTLSDPDRAITYRAGDTISGGLDWTRPIRMGGLQVQRDFTLRSDLVTAPLPQFNGSAAVPSSIDIFINGTKAYSQSVAPGPYDLTNLPLIAQNGTAQVIVRDASGRETQTSLDLFNVSRLMASGLTDFSGETGFARLNYGSFSNDYDKHPLASASLRHGFSDWFTGEVHGEGGAGVLNGGLGTIVRFGPFGVLSTAISASELNKSVGIQAYGSYEWQSRWFTLQVGSQRTFGAYNDLASAVGRLGQSSIYSTVTSSATPAGVFATSGLTVLPPRELDRAAISFPLPLTGANFSFGFINQQAADGEKSRIVTASLSRRLPFNASLFVTAFNDFANRNTRGIFAGISVPLDAMTSATAAASERAGSLGLQTSAQRTQQQQDGTYGWRINDQEGKTPFRQVEASYRTADGQVQATAQQIGTSFGGQAQFDGSVAVLADGIVIGNRTNESFAVVDAGVPGVAVIQDNRPIGVTNGSGKYFVPNLRPYEANKIAIDPTQLPVNADASQTEAIVAPPRLSGALVNFGVKANDPAAVVVLQGKDGKPLAPGTQGQLQGGAAFIIGYDGRAYIKGLRQTNTILIDSGSRQCRATFSYAPTPGQQTLIDGVICQ